MAAQTEIVLSEPGRFESRSGEIPEPGPGEALIRVRHIGVCGTDIHAFFGRQPFFEYPRILGHELGGEVVASDRDRLPVGAICAIEPYLNNSASPASQSGKTNCCEELQVLGVHCDGGMRPLVAVPADKVHVAASLATEQLALVEMLCIGRHAVDRARVEPGEFALVFGAGPIGMSVLQFLKNETERVAVADIDEGRLAFCREKLGIDRTLLVRPGNPVESDLRELGGGKLPTAIFDATGNSGSMMAAFDLIAHGGRIVFVGLFQGEVRFDDPNFHRREITLMSSRNATSDDFRRVIDDIGSGVVDTSPWITHRMSLEAVPKRFRRTIEAKDLRKAVIEVG